MNHCLKFFLLLLVCSLVQTKTFAQTALSIPFEKAYKSGLFTYRLSGLSPEAKFYGKCLQISLSSKVDSDLVIELERGYMFMCHDSGVQNMVHTATSLIALGAGETVVTELYAMCGEAYDDAPNRWKTYTVGVKGDAGLQRLVRLIELEEMQNYSGQLAVWSYLNNISVEDHMESQHVKEAISLLNRAKVKASFNAGADHSQQVSAPVDIEAEMKAGEQETAAEKKHVPVSSTPGSNNKGIFYYLAAAAIVFTAAAFFFISKRKKTKP